MSKALNRRMSDAHEAHLVDLLGGRQSPGSGNQWHAQMDGRHSRFGETYAFAWDGKSTLAKSISVTRAMWDKAVEQAGGERPMLALRFYDTDRLAVGLDLIAVQADDFAEMREEAEKMSQVRALLEGVSQYDADTQEWELAQRLRSLIETGEDPLGVA